jgi:hypothetical protein
VLERPFTWWQVAASPGAVLHCAWTEKYSDWLVLSHRYSSNSGSTWTEESDLLLEPGESGQIVYAASRFTLPQLLQVFRDNNAKTAATAWTWDGEGWLRAESPNLEIYRGQKLAGLAANVSDEGKYIVAFTVQAEAGQDQLATTSLNLVSRQLDLQENPISTDNPTAPNPESTNTPEDQPISTPELLVTPTVTIPPLHEISQSPRVSGSQENNYLGLILGAGFGLVIVTLGAAWRLAAKRRGK